MLRGVRRDDFKLIAYANGRTQLFDLSRDPYETHNLLDDAPTNGDERILAVERSMWEALLHWREAWDDRSHAQGKTFWERVGAVANASDQMV